MTHTPEQIQFYCLDFGGGTLLGLKDLPHVGSVANRLDIRPRVRRTSCRRYSVWSPNGSDCFVTSGIESMADFRRLRTVDLPPGEGEAAGLREDPYGDVFLVVDGWPSVRSDFRITRAPDPHDTLAGQGLSFGVHVIVTTSRWAEIRPALKDQLGTRIELRLGDPGDSDAGRRKAGLGAGKVEPGRGITRDGDSTFSPDYLESTAYRVVRTRVRLWWRRSNVLQPCRIRVRHPPCGCSRIPTRGRNFSKLSGNPVAPQRALADGRCLPHGGRSGSVRPTSPPSVHGLPGTPSTLLIFGDTPRVAQTSLFAWNSRRDHRVEHTGPGQADHR